MKINVKGFTYGMAGLIVAALFCSPIVQADRLDDMISPVANPVNFEDPRINTEIRPFFMHHVMDDDFITAGGDVQLYALQLRAAISDKLAVILTKAGLIDFNPDAALPEETGFTNLSAGVKYAFFQDTNAGQVATAGLRFEAPTGNTDVLQGKGDGQLNPFLSGAYALNGLNLIAGTGLRIPMDDDDSFLYDFDLHVDYRIGDFYPAFEVQVVHVLDAGNRIAIADEGQDLFNLGAIDADGKTLVTAGPAARYRVSDALDVGVAYQIPLTSGRGSNITDWRLTADLIYSFNCS